LRSHARAALETVCYQTKDLLEAMKNDWGASGTSILRVDGGMTASDCTMQFLANILGAAPVDRPKVLETTAIGAAYLVGLQAGLLPEPDVFAKTWKREKRFSPKMDAETRSEKLDGWKEAVRKLLA
jgi:glycerol kinase